jgi:squalene synthase HpnC
MTTTIDEETLIAKAWAVLPANYRMPEVAPTLDQARAWCKHLAESHYENFHVASWFLPEALRPHFHAIYAYCRVSDDLGDEVGDREQSLALLDFWGRELDACYEGTARHPVYVALAEAIRACGIPKEPFADLLVAFRQDQKKTRFENMQEVLQYCRYSANPVGRLVLYATGEAAEGREQAERFAQSDATCSALQLANFWQDVRVDWTKDRVYIPQQDMRRFGVSDDTIAAGIATAEFRALMRYEVGYARELFEKGLPLIAKVHRELALDLDLFSRGGLAILRAIELQNFDVLKARPSISKGARLGLAMRAVAGKFLPFLSLAIGKSGSPVNEQETRGKSA